MKLNGFSIAKDFVALERGSEYFDLHNNFDFSQLIYAPSRRTLELCWRRADGDWVKPTEPLELRLTFSGVYLFRAHERDPEMPNTEDDCLSSIGFMWDNLIEEMNGFASNEPSVGCTHLTAIFMSGFSIKVGAELVSLSVVSK